MQLWLAHALAAAGEVERGRPYLETALRIAGPLGILPEEAEPASWAPLGNYPQALSHLGLVVAALALDPPSEEAADAVAPRVEASR